jgi:hypothetical protein
VPNLKTLREKIDNDGQLLAALDPQSDAFTRLQARITDDTTRLLDYEAILKARRDAIAADEARSAPKPLNQDLLGALGASVIGLIVTYVTWGSWWLLIGVGLLIVGVVNLIDEAPKEWRRHR